MALSHVDTTKPQRRDNIAPSQESFFFKVSQVHLCILYNVYEKSHTQRALPFVIGKNLLDPDQYNNFVKETFLNKIC